MFPATLPPIFPDYAAKLMEVTSRMADFIQICIERDSFSAAGECQYQVNILRQLADRPEFQSLSFHTQCHYKLALVHLLELLRAFRVREGLSTSSHSRAALCRITNELAVIYVDEKRDHGSNRPATSCEALQADLDRLSRVVELCFKPVHEIDAEIGKLRAEYETRTALFGVSSLIRETFWRYWFVSNSIASLRGSSRLVSP
nr:hypothetical protein CFP56_74488 [Quercus suber]